MYDDPDSDNWKDYIMKRERNTIYDEKLVFENSGKVLTLKGHVLEMIIEYKLTTTDSPDAKHINNYMDYMRFDTHARGKTVRGRNIMKTILIEELYLHLG